MADKVAEFPDSVISGIERGESIVMVRLKSTRVQVENGVLSVDIQGNIPFWDMIFEALEAFRKQSPEKDDAIVPIVQSLRESLQFALDAFEEHRKTHG